MNKNEQSSHRSDEKLKELARHVERVEKENAAFFEQLGISSHQVQEFLNDPANFSKPIYEIIKRQKETLIAALDRKITESFATRRSTPSRLEVGAKGHWILVR